MRNVNDMLAKNHQLEATIYPYYYYRYVYMIVKKQRMIGVRIWGLGYSLKVMSRESLCKEFFEFIEFVAYIGLHSNPLVLLIN